MISPRAAMRRTSALNRPRSWRCVCTVWRSRCRACLARTPS
jgi:hypothetical protein